MEIHILDNETINKIAAGEVVERPAGVAKELIENAIDAGASAVSCEIRDGGTTLLRVTDNGCGIAKDQIARAFRRHATSKIREEADLHALTTLGFRGEALSSIAAVSDVEMITKERGALAGVRAVNNGLRPNDTDVIPLELTEVGAPDGTSVIVRNLFHNVPVRKKFLRSAQTEAGYVTDLMEHMALSHPDISFHYRVNGKDKFHSPGNGDIRELIYRLYGREIARAVLPVEAQSEDGALRLSGFIGRPEISRGSRSFEHFFVNGRVLESPLLSRALEAGYRTDLMQHQFPFAVLYLAMPPAAFDVNVHPAKKEVRFADERSIYDFLDEAVHAALHGRELIPEASLQSGSERRREERQELERLNAGTHREPFEGAAPDRTASAPDGQSAQSPEGVAAYRTEGVAGAGTLLEEAASVYGIVAPEPGDTVLSAQSGNAACAAPARGSQTEDAGFFFDDRRTGTQLSFDAGEGTQTFAGTGERESLRPDPGEQESSRVLAPDNRPSYRILGQVFDTYWLVSFKETLLMIDQHAAHEKVNYERMMRRFEERSREDVPSQQLLPPLVVSFAGREEAVYLAYAEIFAQMGYEVEPLGGASYAIRAVPMELYGTAPETLLRDVIDEIMGEKLRGTPQDILSRIATMSCKAAIKGGSAISREEMEALLDEMLTLEDPYHCPHGRPTMIRFTKYEIERKFKRIV